MTKVLVAGDIGQPVYHVGDEAMTVASATFFAGRGAHIVLATRDEEHSRQLIGAGAAGEEYEGTGAAGADPRVTGRVPAQRRNARTARVRPGCYENTGFR